MVIFDFDSISVAPNGSSSNTGKIVMVGQKKTIKGVVGGNENKKP